MHKLPLEYFLLKISPATYDLTLRAATHLAGDGSLKNKKLKEFCQFNLNLLIKISYIPDFKKF